MLSTQTISHKDSPFFNKMVLDFLAEKESILPFSGPKMTRENLLGKIKKKKQTYHQDRNALADVLTKQAADLELSNLQQNNIDLLRKSNTFCFTTAHQINLFTGPLYCIYKALHAIRLAEEAKIEFPDYNFVPVFWIHTEDHDIDEMDHFYLFGKQIKWKHDFQGASGQLASNNLEELIKEVEAALGDNEHANDIVEQLRKHFLLDRPYGKSAAAFLSFLFKEKGLLVLDQHDEDLKKMAKGLFEKELFSSAIKEQVSRTNAALEANGYGTQAFARDINLFFLEGKDRYRIEKKGEQWNLVGTERSINKEELEKCLEEKMIAFSPNVLCRPLFQETVLPNLAYIGGGGELSYWMQLKATFKVFDLPFPFLHLRNSFLFLDKGANKKLNKLGLKVDDLWEEEDALVKRFVLSQTDEHLNLNQEKEEFSILFDQVIAKLKEVDGSLERTGEGEKQKLMKAFANLESKMLRAEKRKHENVTSQLKRLKTKMFPGKSMQERRDNILEYWNRYGLEFIEQIYQASSGFESSFKVLRESE